MIFVFVLGYINQSYVSRNKSANINLKYALLNFMPTETFRLNTLIHGIYAR